jgi:nucleoside-diphosphate-sugar epimerase
MKKIKGRKVVLIGGGGFIGHNLALYLKKRGADVSIIDSLQINNLLSFSSTNNEMVNREFYNKIIQERLNLIYKAGIPLFVQDAREYHQLSKLLESVSPQVVVLLAAVSHASRSNKDPYSTFDHSLRTLENALDWARGSNLEQFIYFSSSMVYGNFVTDPVTEESPCEPLGIYGALKFAAEKIVHAYHQVFNLPYTIVRPSALYGERCVSRRVGQIFIENAMQGQDIIVRGSEGDKLDFTYIEDLVDGICKCIENENAINETFNLTYGCGRSVADMVKILKEHFPHVVLHEMERDNLMPERGTLSVEKARKMIGYNPQNPLEVGFAKYIGWNKSFFRGYTYNARIAKALEDTGKESLNVHGGVISIDKLKKSMINE